MTIKAKAVATHVVPAVTLYSIVAGVAFGGVVPSSFDFKALGTTAIIALLCALAQDIVPRPFKEALVFWKLTNRLPGCRAFTRQTSDRYDLSRIVNAEKLKSLPGDVQQRIFYSTYKKHQSDPSVAHFSFSYIAWRDTATVYFLLALLTLPVLRLMVNVGFKTNFQPAAWLTGFAIAGYLLTVVAARQSANGLVGQVLSCETAEQPHAINI